MNAAKWSDCIKTRQYQNDTSSLETLANAIWDRFFNRIFPGSIFSNPKSWGPGVKIRPLTNCKPKWRNATINLKGKIK